MIPRKLLLAVLFLFPLSVVVAQHVEKRLILVLPDTADLDHMETSIDQDGNYCYYRSYPVGGPVTTNKRTYGPFKKQLDEYSAAIFYNTKDKDQYIKGSNSPVLYGPYDGCVSITGSVNTNEYFAYTISTGDSVCYYINGMHIATTDSDPGAGYRWCVFSGNGSVLYTIRKGMTNYLFFNEKLVDSSKYFYNELAVDDEHNYRYSLGEYVPVDHGWLTYNPYLHPKQKIFGPVAANGGVFTCYNDSEYFYGNADWAAYHIAHDSLYYDPGNGPRIIVAPGNGKNFLSYTPDADRSRHIRLPNSRIWINVNGKAVKLPYWQIDKPIMDSAGNYAFFGLRDYYLYKNINGIEQGQPLSRYGVRATPISIDASGNSICAYLNDDSAYVYENDRLFRKCAIAQFDLLAERSLLPPCNLNEEQTGLSGFCTDGACYIVWRNTISPPILNPRMNFSSDTFKTGDIIYSAYNSQGYWLLQKTGYRKYDLIINNRRVKLPAGVDFDTPMWYQLADISSLTDKAFIFYTEEGRNIYRYKIIL